MQERFKLDNCNILRFCRYNYEVLIKRAYNGVRPALNFIVTCFAHILCGFGTFALDLPACDVTVDQSDLLTIGNKRVRLRNGRTTVEVKRRIS